MFKKLCGFEERKLVNHFTKTCKNFKTDDNYDNKMKNKLYQWMASIILFVMILSGCTPAIASPSIENESRSTTITPTETPTATITPIASYKDATYQIEGQSITLVNGISEIEAAPGSASRIITRYFGNDAFGDLNGDGKEDAAFLLTQENGGSGTFYYIVAALRTDTGYLGTNGIFLGDRIAPQATEIQKGVIIVNYADRNPNDSFAVQPSVAVSKYFRVTDNKLVEVNAP
jgi:hypothetical protein